MFKRALSTLGLALTLCVSSTLAGESQPARLSIHTAHPADALKQGLILRGADARLQLTVTGDYADGKMRDLTREVTFTTAPTNILSISPLGLATPIADGKTTITVKSKDGSVATSIELTVTDFAATPDIHFTNKIVPIFTKYGCNAGGCHGKSGGQNGFRLSLLGFEPQDDYEYLVKEGRGRRLFPAAPDNSLLLLKGANIVPHGGGERISKDTFDYRLIHRWIAQGMPRGDVNAPVVARIEVFPQHRLMTRNGSQQLSVIAVYTDGSTEDVTHTAQFEANNKDMAEPDASGLVKVFEQTGDVAIMVRYASQVGVFRATIPLGAPVGEMPAPGNFIDELVFSKLKMLGMPPSALSDDATFIRRVTLDIAGRLPDPARAAKFIADTDAHKRDKYIDELLDSTDYADFFANKWSSILRNKRRKATYMRGTFTFHDWIRQSLIENKPFDQFVREVLAASGEVTRNPPVVWHREVTKAEDQIEDTAQLFLGVRLQCAKCHHHPFEKWSQKDYYSFTAFFTRISRKPGDAQDEFRITHNRGQATTRHPKTGETLSPAGLGSAPVDLGADDDPRHALVDWMSRKDNPFFAHSLVNRYWKHFFNRGLVDPEDDIRATNPASNPELLDALAASFVESNFDLKKLVKTIAQSKTYQLSSDPNRYNADDRQNFSRYYPRRLNAEVLLDAIDNLCATTTDFAGLPRGTRAVQIPDRGGVSSYFLTVFGAPEGSSVCECERTSDANLAQCLHLLNSQEVQNKLTHGRAKALAADKGRPHEDRVKELYNVAFARNPDDHELKVALAAIEKYGEKNVQWAYEDIVWALINTKEFMFNH